MNLYARHATENQFFTEEEGEWNGYWFAMNWFKPFYTFSNGSFVSYQGYLDYAFDLDTHNRADRTSDNLLPSTVSTGTPIATPSVTA
jgi:nucleoside-specific channel-forming protein